MSQIVKTEPIATNAKRQEYISPAVNIHQDAEDYTLEVEMPGVPKSGVEVTFEDGKLTLCGHRGRDADEAFAYRESSDVDYRRVFDLDPVIDSSRIEASIDQGLLTVRLPKSEAAKPRKIAVT